MREARVQQIKNRNQISLNVYVNFLKFEKNEQD